MSHRERLVDERYNVIALHSIDSPITAAPIPELYEPVLLGFVPLAFRRRGFERVDGPDGRFSVIQEWHYEAP